MKILVISDNLEPIEIINTIIRDKSEYSDEDIRNILSASVNLSITMKSKIVTYLKMRNIYNIDKHRMVDDCSMSILSSKLNKIKKA